MNLYHMTLNKYFINSPAAGDDRHRIFNFEHGVLFPASSEFEVDLQQDYSLC